MHKRYFILSLMALTMLGSAVAQAVEGAGPYLGRWALDLPGGGAGWLGVTDEQGFLDARILWGGGSVLPVANVHMDGDSLVVTRVHNVDRRDEAGEVIRTQQITETLVAQVDGDVLTVARTRPHNDGTGVASDTFTGQRIADLPPVPDVDAAEFGEPIELFNGENLDGWELTNPNQVNGWRAEDGLLINEPVQEEGQPRISYGNLRTVEEFEDFNITLEVKVPENGNSGVYLRGVYEVQVLDSYGQHPNVQGQAAIYSRVAPSYPAEKPAGEWQTMDITLLDRHVTVILNGIKVHDNVPLEGVTGGALWADEFRPGPIFLQGDHTGVHYRNIVLRPVVD